MVADNGERVHLDLGRKYNEELRRYLFGERPIPPNARLLVSVCTDEISQKTFFMPGENKRVKDNSYGVVVRGLFLLFRISSTPPDWHTGLSMINNQPAWISVWDCLAQKVWNLGDGT
jgi:hypothetical protein